ncbi:hypothetical protein Syun_027503 [Stephania yunnanensis]|uniref:Uncharacterized protein n=1 Tax=Stephania yunnanensis TaxID=152371 RepID=A0AAP0HQ06_9MAGN
MDNAFQADQNVETNVVEVDVDPLVSMVVDLTSEIVFDNDEFETLADDDEDDEFTSSSDSSNEDERRSLNVVSTRQEMFRHLHTNDHDSHTFVDQRSAKIDIVEELSTQSPDTPIDEDAVYFEVVPEVKGHVYGLGSQSYHRHISSLREASSSRGPAYGPHELKELLRDHQRLQETLMKERMERQDQM